MNAIVDCIRNDRMSVEEAVRRASESFAQMLLGTQDSYMKERVVDVEDICQRLICELCEPDCETDAMAMDEAGIMIAQDLMPSETMEMDTEKVMAFVTQKGSSVSHVAILVRSLGIPAVVGLIIPSCYIIFIVID